MILNKCLKVVLVYSEMVRIPREISRYMTGLIELS